MFIRMSFAQFFHMSCRQLGAQHVLVIGVVVLALMVPVLFIGGFFSYLAYEQTVYVPKAAQIMSELENELSKIAPLPSAEVRAHDSGAKAHVVSITTEYRTDLSYQHIRAYYDAELAKHGWRFAVEEGVTHNWQDYGGKQALYCKGGYTADLFYTGRQAEQFGWTYAFSLSWGTYDQCK